MKNDSEASYVLLGQGALVHSQRCIPWASELIGTSFVCLSILGLTLPQLEILTHIQKKLSRQVGIISIGPDLGNANFISV